MAGRQTSWRERREEYLGNSGRAVDLIIRAYELRFDGIEGWNHRGWGKGGNVGAAANLQVVGFDRRQRTHDEASNELFRDGETDVSGIVAP